MFAFRGVGRWWLLLVVVVVVVVVEVCIVWSRSKKQ